MVITGLTFATSDTGVAAFVVTALVMSAVVIAGFTFAASNIGVDAFVVTALAMAAMIITAFATSDTGVAALVVTAFAMAAMIVTSFAFASSEVGIAASIIAPLVVPVPAVITAVVELTFLPLFRPIICWRPERALFRGSRCLDGWPRYACLRGYRPCACRKDPGRSPGCCHWRGV